MSGSSSDKCALLARSHTRRLGVGALERFGPRRSQCDPRGISDSNAEIEACSIVVRASRAFLK